MTKKTKAQFQPVGDVVSIYKRGKIWQANYQQNDKQYRRSLKTSIKKEALARAAALEI